MIEAGATDHLNISGVNANLGHFQASLEAIKSTKNGQ
jgi:hypothetical protein